MRLGVSLILLCCFAWTTGMAQQADYFSQPDKNGREKTFYGGIVLGMNASQIDGDTYSGFHKAGLNMGIAAYVKFKPKIISSLELLYAQKGARNVDVYNSPAVGSVPIIYTAKLNYVEIPVMVHYTAMDRLQVGAGLSYSRLFSDKEEMDSYTGGGTGTLENTYRKQDINYLASVTYQLYLIPRLVREGTLPVFCHIHKRCTEYTRGIWYTAAIQ
jgi:hypothetical protein